MSLCAFRQGVKVSSSVISDYSDYYAFQVLFHLLPKRTLNLHLAYFSETLYSASPQINKKALILLRIRAFPNFAFLRSGAYGTRTRDPMRDRHVF